MVKVYPLNNAEQLTADLTPLDKDVLSIIHQYISINFDVDFLRAALKFFSPLVADGISMSKIHDFEDKQPSRYPFQGHLVKIKDPLLQDSLISLLKKHIITTDVDKLVVKEQRDVIGVKDDLTINKVHPFVSMKCPRKGFSTCDIFRMLKALAELLDKRYDHFDRVVFKETDCRVEAGERVLTLYADIKLYPVVRPL